MHYRMHTVSSEQSAWARRHVRLFCVVLIFAATTTAVEGKIPLNELSSADQIRFDDDVLPGPTAEIPEGNVVQSIQLVKTGSDFRLPTAVVPVSYRLETRPILDEAEGQVRFTSPSKVWIHIRCEQDTNKIVLHAQGLNITQGLTEVNSLNDSASKVTLVGQEYDSANNFFVVTLNDTLKAGNDYELFLDFVAPVYLDRKDGIYRTVYPDPANRNNSKSLVSTLFAPTSARRAFPCFDEPQLRATFTIRIGRTANYSTLCNMDLETSSPIPVLDGWYYDNYKTTIPMSTYLIAMTISNFANHSLVRNQTEGTEIQTWADVSHIEKGRAEYSVNVTGKILPYLEEYLNYSYVLPKLDSVAMPRISYGGMESWGLIIYQDLNLLYVPGKTSEDQRKRTTALISHELAHQWFGNLVTFGWWSDLWLSEGITTYFQYVGVAGTYPEFDSWNNFVSDVLQPALHIDAFSVTSHPLHNPVESASSIMGVYDKIAYDKGSAIIRMTEHFLTEPVFQAGIQRYLKKYAFKAVHQDQLFEALNEEAIEASVLPPNVTVKDILDTWTLQAGFPIITVNKMNETGEISIAQSQYDPEGLGRNGSWWVPITFSTPRNFNFEDTMPSFWMSSNQRNISINFTAEPDEWILINSASTGFYRVLYDESITEAIQSQLYIEHEFFPASARNRLIDDYFTMSYKGMTPIETALNMISYMGKETEFSVLKTILVHIKFITEMFSGEDDVHLTTWINTKLDNIFSQIDSELSPELQEKAIGVVRMRRHLLMSWACYFKNPRCIKYARDLSEQWRQSPETNPIPAGEKAAVYCAIAASNNTEDQDFLLSRYKNEDDVAEATLLIEGLGCAQDMNMVQSELDTMSQTLLTDTETATMHFNEQEQKLKMLLKGAIKSSPEGRELSWKFIRSFFVDAAKSDKLSRAVNLSELVGLLGYYWNTPSSRADLENFINSVGNDRDSLSPSLRSVVAKSLQSSLEKVEENIEWTQKFYDRTQSWFALENFYFPEGFLN